jgi:hypothetical protein
MKKTPAVLDTFPFSDAVDPRLFSVDLSAALASGDLDLNATNLVDYLDRTYPPGRRLKMLAHLHAWQRLFQYSLDPVHELIAFDQVKVVQPVEDAFTASWKAVLRSLCARGQLPKERCLARAPSSES